MKNNMCEMDDNCNAINDLKSIRVTIEKIETALLGNEYNQEGYLKKVDRLEIDVQTIKERMSMVKWVAIGYLLAGVGLGATAIKILL